MLRRIVLLLCLTAVLGACKRGSDTDGAANKPLSVYSARNEQLIQPLIARWSEQTGTPVQLVTADAGPLLERLRAEGEATPADVLLTVDAGNLWQAAELDLLQSLEDTTLTQRIPAHLRDPGNRWFGLSVRARTVLHHTQRAPAAQIDSYAALGNPQWKGRLCLRTSKKVYNQSLVAMLIAEHGEAGAEAIVRRWVGNLAAPPFANDTAVIEAIAAGQCDVGIINTYYFGRWQAKNPDAPLALFWPDQGAEGRGVHVNVSGGGVVKYSDAPTQAQAFLEWLAAPEAQAQFAGANLEYPANSEVAVDPVVAAWGAFRQNLINVSEAGKRQAEAVKLMDRAGYR